VYRNFSFTPFFLASFNFRYVASSLGLESASRMEPKACPCHSSQLMLEANCVALVHCHTHPRPSPPPRSCYPHKPRTFLDKQWINFPRAFDSSKTEREQGRENTRNRTYCALQFYHGFGITP